MYFQWIYECGSNHYVDIQAKNGHYINISVECSMTNLIPDLCVLCPNEKKLFIIGLAVLFDPNIHKAHRYMFDKYCPLVSDIESNGFTVELIPVEIGSKGYLGKDNNDRLKHIHKSLKVAVPFKQFRLNNVKLTIISSFVIYHAKTEPTWCDLPLLKI